MTESTRATFSALNPSPASESYAKFLANLPETKEAKIAITPAIVDLVTRNFSAWQQSPARVEERKAEKVARAEAKKIAEGRALLAKKTKLEAELAKIAAAEEADAAEAS
jgi:hypothetical protein